MKQGHRIGLSLPAPAEVILVLASAVRAGAAYLPIRQTWRPTLHPAGLQGVGLAAVYARHPPATPREVWLQQEAQRHPSWVAFVITENDWLVLLPPDEPMREIA